MIKDISGDPSAHAPKDYHPQFKIDVEYWRKMWQPMFKSELTDPDVHQMTDTFVKMISDDCNRALKHAIAAQKELHRKEKEDREG